MTCGHILSEVASVVMSARANYTSFFMQYRLDALPNKCVKTQYPQHIDVSGDVRIQIKKTPTS